MYFYVDDKWELYDLKKDPTEMNNLYGQKGMEKLRPNCRRNWSAYRRSMKFRQSCANDIIIVSSY